MEKKEKAPMLRVKAEKMVIDKLNKNILKRNS